MWLLLSQTFLAQKYGYRPFPPKIKANEFEALLSAITDKQEEEILTEWFVLDKNIVPPIYRLQPIRSKLPDYANDSKPEEKKQVN